MKCNVPLLVSFAAAVLSLLGLFCNALPILYPFNRDNRRQIPKSKFDIYGKDLLVVDEALTTTASDRTTLPTSSGFFILPHSGTTSTPSNSPNRQTVFLDTDGLTVRLNKPMYSATYLDPTPQLGSYPLKESKRQYWSSYFYNRGENEFTPKKEQSRIFRG